MDEMRRDAKKDVAREELRLAISALEMRMAALAGRMAAPAKGDRPEALAAEYDALAGLGWVPCDHDLDAGPGTVLLPLTRGDAPLSRKMFAFWPEARDSSLQWEFAEVLSRHFV